MKKWLCIFSSILCLSVMLTAVPKSALADRMYLIPDSDRRMLTEEELWEWDYESLGYILNEIFARHGYVFISGGRYDYYFSSMPWYTPNASSDNSRYCYPQLNNIEWYNEQLIKDVRAQMRAWGTTNPGGRSVWDNFSTGFSVLQGFDYTTMRSGQRLAVYAAPATNAWRGANGKAMISTNGAVYTAGWENGWLLVMYETNNGGVRVGYVSGGDISGSVSNNRRLQFAYTTAQVTRTVQLTDDPAASYTQIMTLSGGSQVTYLTTFINNRAWDYVETTLNGKPVRGFIPAGSLSISTTVYDDSEFSDDGAYH